MNTTTTTITREEEKFNSQEVTEILRKIQGHIRRNLKNGGGRTQIARLLVVNNYLNQLERAA